MDQTNDPNRPVTEGVEVKIRMKQDGNNNANPPPQQPPPRQPSGSVNKGAGGGGGGGGGRSLPADLGALTSVAVGGANLLQHINIVIRKGGDGKGGAYQAATAAKEKPVSNRAARPKAAEVSSPAKKSKPLPASLTRSPISGSTKPASKSTIAKSVASAKSSQASGSTKSATKSTVSKSVSSAKSSQGSTSADSESSSAASKSKDANSTMMMDLGSLFRKSSKTKIST